MDAQIAEKIALIDLDIVSASFSAVSALNNTEIAENTEFARRLESRRAKMI